MHRRIIAPGALAVSLMLAIPASAADYEPGAPGIGDPYYPAYGNGGYDVSHYDLRLKYRPETDKLEGTATLLATTTQDLSRFNLDFLLDVSEVRVNGAKASFKTSDEHELEVTPKTPLPKGTPVTVVVRYSGVPSSKSAYGFTSWHRTADGGVGANEPEAAWWWFPSNDHPLDKATYDVSVAVPDGSQAISNGTLQSTSSRGKLDALQLAVQQAAGHVSRHAGDREVRRHDRQVGERHPDRQRVQQGTRRPLRGGAREHRAHRGGRRLADGVLRAVPVQRARRLRPEHHRDRVRAGDPDAALLQPAPVRERYERVGGRP